MLGEDQMLTRLRQGDESAFAELVDCYGAAMLRVAQAYVRDASTAEEVVQDTWLALLRGLERFEGRSSLRSWLFAVLVNRAKTRGTRDARTVPFSALAREETASHEPAVERTRFLDADARWPGHWRQPPAWWGEEPEQRLMQAETLRHLASALDGLPPAQRTVVVLRDVAMQDAKAVCDLLGISEANARVLLHRGRSKLRRNLEHFVAAG